MTNTSELFITKFPEYQFQSTNIFRNYAPYRLLLLILCILGALIWTYDFMCNFIRWGFVVIIYGGIPILAKILTIPTIGTGVYFTISWYKNSPLTNSFADYVQSKGRFRFFVKDGKMGVVRWFDFHIMVPATYEKLIWIEENKTLRATFNGENFLIDIHNNRVVG